MQPGNWMRVLVLLIAFAGVPARALSQASNNEAQVKAAFVYNFLKFVEWPESVLWGSRDSIIVGFVGGGPTLEAAAVLLVGKSVNGHGIAIRRLQPDQSHGGVHALFFGSVDAATTRRTLKAMAGFPVLTIGESVGFGEGGGVIGLMVEKHKIRFEINTQAATTAGLKISSKLLALARIVQATPVAQAGPR